MRVLLTADPGIPVPPKLYGGIERIVDGLANELRKRGHQIGLIASNDSKCQVNHFYPWPFTRPNNRSEHFQHLRFLRSTARAWNPDIVHSFSRLGYLVGALGAGFPVIDSPRFLWSSNFLGALTHEAVSLVRPGRSLPVRCCGPRSTAVFRTANDYHRRLFSDSRGSRPTNHSGRPMDCVLGLDSQPGGGQGGVADLDDRGRRWRPHRVDCGGGELFAPALEPRWQMACVCFGSRRRQNASVAAESSRR